LQTSPTNPRTSGGNPPVAKAGTDMAARVHRFDWSRTALGPMESWPASLRVAVDLCLNNRFPMHVWWGPKLINIYNDAHVPVLGKRHPDALGQPARDVWAEVWHLLAPQVEAVMQRGQSTWNEQAQVKLERNGFAEDAWFTWSYSPIHDEAGHVGGLICVATEDTARVLAERERDALEEQRQHQRALERARAEEALRDSNTLLRGISDSTGDVIFAKDRDGRMRFANPAALSVIGKTMGQILGKTDDEFLDDKAAAQAAMTNDRHVMETGISADFEEVVTAADGTRRIWFSTKMPYRDAAGQVIGILGISRDITKRKAIEEEARRAKDAAETANKAKDRLLAVVSHELRTPLNPIMAITTHLQSRADLPADIQEDMNTIRRNVEQEARIIDDLLNVTRLQREKIILHQEAVDLHAMLAMLVEQFSQRAVAKRIHWELSLNAASPYLWADPGRMQQAFSNLLDNAVKFTPQNGRITVRSDTTPNGKIRIEVTDTGIGIDPDVLPRLFAPFEQGKPSVTQRFGGLGLGLVIVKGIIDLHGGAITAASAGHDQGTTVVVELNALEHGLADAPPASSPHLEPGTIGKRILLVEDHEDTLRIMRRVLASLGYIATTATNVAEALARIEAEEFDLLVSDIGLPDGSGLDIMRALRQRRGGKGIALSGFGNDEDIRQSLDAGFAEHLIKPVDMRILDSTLRRVALSGGDGPTGKELLSR